MTIQQDYNPELIYDVGFHRGESASYYLSQGFRVIAIDANASMVKEARIKFCDAIKEGSLTLLHRAVTDKSDEKVDFYLSLRVSEWSSLYKKIPGRVDASFKKKTVRSVCLSTLFQHYGTPYYCKIDIEGADSLALQSLKKVKNLPPYISVESECCGADGCLDGEELETLNLLHELGYKKFKLVEQNSLKVLGASRHYQTFRKGLAFHILRKAREAFTRVIELVCHKSNQIRADASPIWGGSWGLLVFF